MSHVITASCCNDAGCVAACPVNCIHPTPDEPDFATAEMLYVDPATCIDCGACVSECPVDAIVPAAQLPTDAAAFIDINAAYYRDHDVRGGLVPFRPAVRAQVPSTTRVAIVGSGPAGMYTAKELLAQPNIEVDVIDRLPTPLGLIRSGVSPDHQSTKKVGAVLDSIAASPRVRYLLGVDVGTHVSSEELAEGYHAVVYAHGAFAPKSLGLNGEELPGSVSSSDFVGWYNGHPDFADHRFDLSGERAVIVGNGNVALDIARVLLTDPDDLALTDIADDALKALRESAIREVVVLGRRAASDAAYTVGELAALAGLRDVDVIVDEPLPRSAGDALVQSKIDVLRTLSARTRGGGRRLVFRFGTTPTAILGVDHVTGLDVADGTPIASSLLIRAIGYAGQPIGGVPFDTTTGTVPHRDGRIVDPTSGEWLRGRYVAGWIKRGSRGGIGANRRCAEETARSLLDDAAAGLLTAASTLDVAELARGRGATVVDAQGWRRIDAAERSAGVAAGRVRVKMTDFDELLTVAEQAG
ncbi:FAD-dependent oxidoreductase [Gordonia sp. TBRC 11910]|uniref:ferredoxin--NADP(+) reductase n=1 Tax=Gordonia asplenii TaxID=2725283 RepID=A0A848L2G3_9ACTN|nr:FAD-dependent oxidoreductase [Gordonia asplenii]NMO04677.1 FAD-dependent oxidoreductase [Gordonia asplenii]